MPEILNIEYHTKILMHKALNKYPTVNAAAQALSITERTLYRYIVDWFFWNPDKAKWDFICTHCKASIKTK